MFDSSLPPRYPNQHHGHQHHHARLAGDDGGLPVSANLFEPEDEAVGPLMFGRLSNAQVLNPQQ